MGKYAKSAIITNHQEMTVGDTVRVFQKIYEEGKTRSQVFEGVLLSINNRGENKSFTVRKISYDKVAVERIWPLNSPHIEKIEVKKKGKFHKAKLYFLRDKI